jgi:putative Holliday junction resolvase
MRVAALDFGKVRVGLALSDDLGLLAHPRPQLDGRDPGRLIAELASLAENEGIDLFVVGLPRRLDGSEGAAAQRARRFAERLGRRTATKVELVDERLSTRQAHALLQEAGHDTRAQRSRLDSAAAAVLLQSWLDARRGADA